MRSPRSKPAYADATDTSLPDMPEEALPGPDDSSGDGPGHSLLDDDLAARMRPSKTQLKKQMLDLQTLGEALAALPVNRTENLGLSDTLQTALRDYRQTKSHEGKRRQLQYIGKLMRHTDPEPIREAVAAMQIGSAKDTLALHKAEGLRTLLIEDDEALTRWLEDHPTTDVQQIRSLIRAARKDAAAEPHQRNGRAFRELFQVIKQHQLEEEPDGGSAS